MTRRRFLPSAVSVVILTSGCAAPAWKTAPHDRPYQRTPTPQLHPRPSAPPTSEWWWALTHSTVRPLGELLSPYDHVARALGGSSALDVNAFGQVIDSSWFHNRIGRGTLRAADAARGPNRLQGPAQGPLAVLGGKIEGATPGLLVRDANGITFLVKFDPPAFPELVSGAEAIATKILHAAGYSVPENYVALFDISRLVVAPGAQTVGDYGEPVPLDQRRLDDLLSHVNPFPDGTVRALFSRIVPGVPLGPFDYRGTRSDDPNDLIPHEHRRSLRALWLFNAWINNPDTRASNTIDVWIPLADDASVGHVEHYLLDFGDALGAAGVAPKYIGSGYEGRVDWSAVAAAFFSLGLHYPYWLPVRRAPYRSVGVLEADVFEPDRWRPSLPNPAFDEVTMLDTYWAASIIARFTPEILAAIVRASHYTEPGAAEWILRVLSERQFKILERVFSRVLPLEEPRVAAGYDLTMTDLAVESFLVTQEERRYHWRLRWNRSGTSDIELASGTVRSPRAPLAAAIEDLRRKHGAALASDPFVTVTWTVGASPDAGPSVEVHLRLLQDRLLPVAMERSVD